MLTRAKCCYCHVQIQLLDRIAEIGSFVLKTVFSADHSNAACTCHFLVSNMKHFSLV
jgi:hypothetical protein